VADRLRADDGANAVEFALVLPILVILVFGIFTVGMAYNTKLVANHAARDAARFGATLPEEDVDDDNVMDQGWFEDVRDRAVEAGEGYFGSLSGGTFTGHASAVICVAYSRDGTNFRSYTWSGVSGPTTGAECYSDSLSAAGGERVQVVLEQDAAFNIVFLPARTLDLSSVAVARFEDRPEPVTPASPVPSPSP
jgi:hypothetical protein